MAVSKVLSSAAFEDEVDDHQVGFAGQDGIERSPAQVAASPQTARPGSDQARPIGHRMQSDPVGIARPLGQAHAIVPDAQDARPVLRAQADLDPLRPSVNHRVVDGFLRDAK